MANAILDALGYIGDTLDKPGRAVRGVLGGRPGEALAAVPFSDSLGLTDPGNRVSGSDLLRQLGADPGDGLGGTLAGMGVEMATDPLTWAGAGLGGLLGKRAGAAAMARGPRYETSADDLARMVGGTVNDAPHGGYAPTPMMDLADLPSPASGGSVVDNPLAGLGREDLPQFHLDRILQSPHAARVLSEVPPGSSYLGSGAEALALRTPAGDVVRIGSETPYALGRPASDAMLPATRAVDVPDAIQNFGRRDTTLRVERTPFASHVGDRAVLSPRDPATMLRPMDDVAQRLRADGLEFWDNHAGNVGMYQGRPVAIDPGAVATMEGFAPTGGRVGRHADPSWLMSALAALGGGDEAVRAAINAGRVDPGMMMSLARVGGMGGAGVGAAGRTFEGF